MPRRRFWSVFPSSVKEATDAIVANLLLHAFPARMRVTSLGWAPSLWLGTVSWVLFVALLVTGLPLMVFYIPSTREAYQSIKDIEHVVSFGWWLRAAHRVAAHAMVVAVTLHLARVFLTGSYRNAAPREQHREWNWVIGVSLLAATVLLSFTGYLLPWDQLAYWAVTTSMNIVAAAPLVGRALRAVLLGADEVGQPALMRFYVLHIVVLPVAVAALFAYHMWRIRKDGGLAHPGEAQEGEDALVVNAIPAVVIRVAVVSVATWLAVTVLALVIPSPLEEAANALLTPNPAKAPWYFLWLQEIVADTTVRLGTPHDQRRARRGDSAAGRASGCHDPLAVARPVASRHRRCVDAPRAEDADPGIRRAGRPHRRAHGRGPAPRAVVALLLAVAAVARPAFEVLRCRRPGAHRRPRCPDGWTGCPWRASRCCSRLRPGG